ncbi:ABC transporter ATP-binding protein [Candidatus Spongiisocius sp.]|uniref:ABC transporter ATP-binding protein n=1 Tax=Candidatus Spongiisocius sp. TaxID=3101273 RepID=UPI003B5A968A
MPSVSPPAAAANGSHEVALSVRDLVKTFLVGGGVFGGEKGEVSAVAGVSFEIGAGRTLGLVGESGCGKSTTARSILRLIEPTSGEVVLTRPLDEGGSERIDVIAADRRQLRELRRHMQIVFQDPFASLNPRMSVGTAIGELLHVHTNLTRKERGDRVGELLSLVGMNPNVADRYPHEFSGGQRQRIGVARALALNPGFLILDEPVSALDVSIQAQVLNLLEELQDRLGLTYLFIAHDLAVVRHICDETAVMYLGKIVEQASTDRLFTEPMHPYTQALLSAVPTPNPKLQRQRSRILLEGDVPSPLNPPSGCRFHTRCPIGRDKDICRAEEPPLKEEAPGHLVACHFAEAKAII